MKYEGKTVNYRFITVSSTFLICLVLAVVVNGIYGIDIVYTHLFYIPIILTGIWYPRYAVFLAAALGLIHIACDYIAGDTFTIGSFLRAIMFLVVAYLTSYLVVRVDHLHNSLRENSAAYRALFADSRDAVMTFSPDEGFINGNPACIRLFACRDEDDFTSRTPASLSPNCQPGGALSTEKAQEMMRLALEQGSHFFEWTHQRVDGTVFPATILLSRIESGCRGILQATVRDNL